ncbi:23498_t:CDS:1, partial [Racocetra persica]
IFDLQDQGGNIVNVTTAHIIIKTATISDYTIGLNIMCATDKSNIMCP